jgi:MoaA/NifB/PqqE/SkfB family radical SAM enzyme
MIIFGAGVVGEATLYACRAKGITVECFVDDRIKGSLLGVPILKTSEVKGGFYYLTSPNIHDMIGPVVSKGGSWYSCGEVLKDFDISGIDFLSINGDNKSSKYTTEHVKYLIRTVLHHHENYLDPTRLSIQNVDLIITERCSMKCKDCANLMQYYENPENSDLNEMVQTIDSLCEKADEVYEVRVIGGEPFMNKEIHLIVEKLTSKENVHKVSIFTNATIVPRDTQWKALQHPKVRFFITEYLQSRNLAPLIAALEERKIPYVSEQANGWTDSAALDKHNRTDEENERVFQTCCAKNLATLHDGFLYRCPFSANASKLKAIPDYKDDYIEVRTASREQIKSFLRDQPFIGACDHCRGRSYDAPVIVPAIQIKTPLKYFKHGSLVKSD